MKQQKGGSSYAPWDVIRKKRKAYEHNRHCQKSGWFGRIVIPKEIRQTLRIREGTPRVQHLYHPTSLSVEY